MKGARQLNKTGLRVRGNIAKARADVRSRTRGDAIRTRTSETRIRAAKRITAEQDTTRMTHLIFRFFVIQNKICFRCFLK